LAFVRYDLYGILQLLKERFFEPRFGVMHCTDQNKIWHIADAVFGGAVGCWTDLSAA